MVQAFICDSVRTPFGRYGGSLASMRADDLAAHPIQKLIQRNTSLDPACIDEVVFGCANQAGEDNRNVARMAALLAGLPESVPGLTVNRLCASGMEAVGLAARSIRCGESCLSIAGGVESMSRAPYVMPKAESAFSRHNEIFDTTIGWRFINPRMQEKHGTDSMPETGENVATDFAISREDQDGFAVRSQQRTARAQARGRLAEEIEPVLVPQGRGTAALFETDEHPRNTTLERLSNLPTPFREGGTVTAGNASGVNDGAAALFVANEDTAAEQSLIPIARIVGMASAGVAPRVMGIGPAPATEALLNRCRLTIDDIDLFEINEAFAAQALAVTRQLGLDDDDERVNPNGGAIALGHPLGASGARLVLTAARELQHRRGRYALCSMCVGVGQGVSILLERV